jgi:cytochrome c-type protein NapC
MKRKVIILLTVGVLLGVALTLSFNGALHYTSTDRFCLSCHNHQIPFDELTATKHWQNSAGIVAHCSDCHIPHEFGPKMLRKLAAVKEVYGQVTGVIDSNEKYLAHRQEMKASEIARLKSNDSAECRNCHLAAHMNLSSQSPVAQRMHKKLDLGMTCIDCHQGIAHSPVPTDDDYGF